MPVSGLPDYGQYSFLRQKKFFFRQDFKDIIETATANFRPIVITPDQSLVPLFYQILIPTLRHVPFVSLYDKITVILNTMQLMDIKKPVSGKRIFRRINLLIQVN
nr:MAG TPA: hypothetical protein [Caudoviricetes sp.]